MILAEVMDKEPSLIFLWSYFLAIGLVGSLLGAAKWWYCAAIVPFWAIFALVQISELYDPIVGPAIISEAGWSYFWHSYAAVGSGVLLPSAGIVIGILSRCHRSHLQGSACENRNHDSTVD